MIEKLFGHIENARRLLLDAAQKLDKESFLGRSKGASSIRDLFVHLMDAEDFWIGSVILGEKRQKFVPEKYEDVRTLSGNWTGIHLRTKKLVSDISAGHVSLQMSVPWEKDTTLDVGSILLHVAAHEIHHDGEICLLMRQRGHEPPYLDLL